MKQSRPGTFCCSRFHDVLFKVLPSKTAAMGLELIRFAFCMLLTARITLNVEGYHSAMKDVTIL